jgi:hypothetical protein
MEQAEERTSPHPKPDEPSNHVILPTWAAILVVIFIVIILIVAMVMSYYYIDERGKRKEYEYHMPVTRRTNFAEEPVSDFRVPATLANEEGQAADPAAVVDPANPLLNLPKEAVKPEDVRAQQMDAAMQAAHGRTAAAPPVKKDTPVAPPARQGGGTKEDIEFYKMVRGKPGWAPTPAG